MYSDLSKCRKVVLSHALGKVVVLPKGVGIWKYAVRSYTSMSSSFDRDGYVQSTGGDFKQTFKGQDLVREVQASDSGTTTNGFKDSTIQVMVVC